MSLVSETVPSIVSRLTAPLCVSAPPRLRVSIFRLTTQLVFLCTVLAISAQDKPADLPIKRVVMFSSGVAFFEHAGQVDGNAQVEMKFDVKDINDLLKSMVLQD